MASPEKFITIAGIVYNLDRNSTVAIPHGYYKYETFIDNFDLKEDAKVNEFIGIASKYFSVSDGISYKNDPIDVEIDSARDKKLIIALLIKRKDKILKTNEYISSEKLSNVWYHKELDNINKLLRNLEKKNSATIKNSHINSPDNSCLAKLHSGEKLSEDCIIEIILEVGWYLSHPEIASDDVKKDWNTLSRKIDKLSFKDIIKDIKLSNSDDNKSDYLQNVYSVIKADTTDNAKSKIIKALKNKSHKYNTSNVEQIMKLLKMKKYLDIGNLDKHLIKNPVQSGGADSLRNVMTPIFLFLERLYNPIYEVLDKSIKKYHKEEEKVEAGNEINNIPALLKILCVMQSLSNEKMYTEGIYRINNIDKNALIYIKTQLKYILGYINDNNPSHEEAERWQVAQHSINNVASLNIYIALLLGHMHHNKNQIDQSISDDIPYRIVELYTTDNLMVTKRSSHAYFNDNSLYILCNDVTRKTFLDRTKPLKVYNIEYDSINYVNDLSANNVVKSKEINVEVAIATAIAVAKLQTNPQKHILETPQSPTQSYDEPSYFIVNDLPDDEINKLSTEAHTHLFKTEINFLHIYNTSILALSIFIELYYMMPE